MPKRNQTLENTKAIENGFPTGFVSYLAEHESWRKEIYRPIYYIHKWWARRLGSVFRAIILGSCLDSSRDVEYCFYRPSRFPEVTVFDPFMGSGTTIGEALKLGCRVIGRDINPVSHLMVIAALQAYSVQEIQDTFKHLTHTVGERIRAFHSVTLPDGQKVEVLYYFWVMVIPCPFCEAEVELYKTRIFSKNASPKNHPEAKAICPNCKAINETRYNAKKVVCLACQTAYNPQVGNIINRKAQCANCGNNFPVIRAVRKLAHPPLHKMYAKMILTESGEKIYLPIDEQDLVSYELTTSLLPGLLKELPQVEIQPGYNTDQILNYNYKSWHELFNARQLVSLALLSLEIRNIKQPEIRSLFAVLFSSTLEFNNMFCSFKGEGTGAVRPIFAHHILKPELMTLEANVWGTPKSSGSFSTFFESRILRALAYKSKPFEFKVTRTNGKSKNRKVYGLSDPISFPIAKSYQDFISNPKAVYLSSGDSSDTDLPDASVNLVITDPPFFDNVHYSQLADFFYVWLQKVIEEKKSSSPTTTRSSNEVQDTDADRFSTKLAAVFRECYRVLKPDGLFVFTYHHSRIDGWVALYKAIREAGFYVTHTHPVKSEMAVAIPIQQAKTPINFDLIVVCRKNLGQSLSPDGINLPACLEDTQQVITELQSENLQVSPGDIKVIFLGCVLSRLSRADCLPQEIEHLQKMEEESANILCDFFDISEKGFEALDKPVKTPQQLTLFSVS